MRYYPLFLVLLFPAITFAQKAGTPALRLSCPLANAVEVIEKQPYNLGKDLKIILSSSADTTVKASVAGTITNVQQDDKTWIVVLNNRNYYIWYSGITKPLVREEQKVKNGDPVGQLSPGGKVELHVFDFETPVDPKKYLDCKLSE